MIHHPDLARKRRWLGASLASLLTVAVGWLFAHEGHAPLPTRGAQVDVPKGQIVLSRDARDALDVQTAEVGVRPLEERILAYTSLVAPWQGHAYATARLPGRIDRLHVKPGETVAAGQVLADVQSLELENLQLELVNVRNDVELSAKVLASAESGSRSGTVTEQRLEETRARHQENVNVLDVARAKWLGLGLPRENLDQVLQQRNPRLVRTLPVRSPIAGIVIHTDLTVGKVVEVAEHLFEIVDLSSIWVKIGVLEKDLARVAVGQPVELSLAAYPGAVFRTQVEVMGQYLDPQTHLGTVWAALSNPSGREPRFLPGMAGQAHLIIPGARKMPTVPADALLGEGAERFVLIEEADVAGGSQYRKQDVTVRRQTPEYALLEGAVFPGDRVVTRGGHELATYFVPTELRLSKEAAKNIGLRVEPVQVRQVDDVMELDGIVTVPPDRRTFASSQLAGTLQRIAIDRGQRVRAGDVLAEVASLELQNLQLELLRAHGQTQLLEEALQRLRKAESSLPRRQLWETESACNAARNRRNSLLRKLDAAGLSAAQRDALLTQKKLAETLPVRAAIDGTVVHFDKVLGQAIKAEEPLFEIHDLSRIWVQGFLSESDLARTRLDAPASVRVRLTADPGFLGSGKVQRSGRVFGAEDRTLSLWVELDGPAPAAVQHNMLARLSLPVGRTVSAPAVPRSAVVQEGTRAYVFVPRPDGTFERRTVTTGRADDRHVAIVAGLEAGEPVVVHGAAELQTAFAVVR